MARESRVEARYVADFKPLYRFYLEMEHPGPNEPEAEPATRSGLPEQENFRTVAASPELQAFFTDAAAARQRYGQRIGYYLLLKSFYNAFIFPLEKEVSISRSAEVLGGGAVGFTGGKEITPPQLATLRSAAIQSVPAEMRNAFEAMGRISFPDTFNTDDFTTNNLEQI